MSTAKSAQKPAQTKFVFTDENSAARAPFEGAAPEKFWTNPNTKGFGVVVSRPDESGNVKRWYAVRVDKLRPDGTVKDEKVKLGAVGALRFGDAQAQAAAARERARKERKTGVTSLPTLSEAFEGYMLFKTKVVATGERIRPRTVEDYRSRWDDMIPTEWHGVPIDKLTVQRWTDLRVESTTPLSFEKRLRKPVSESRFDGMMRGIISGLYNHYAASNRDLVNPVPILRKRGIITKRTPEKHDFIETERLKATVQLAEQEMRAPQRDILIIGMLTGWRDSLIRGIPLNRIDKARRTVEWRATDEGGPYAEPDGDSFAYPVSDWLWDRVFAPRLAVVKPGQKFLIESGRKPGKPFKDIRESLKLLDDVAGVHMTAHVLRKTMITLAPSAHVHQRTIGQLAMHKSTGGGLTMTGSYQKRDYAQMRDGANAWATWFAEMVGWTRAAEAAPAPAPIAGMTTETMDKLQTLASMDPAALDKLLRLAEALK